MSDAVVYQLSIAGIIRLGRGFQAHISEQHSLVLTHPWIEVAMNRDKARPLNERVLWRPVMTFGPNKDAEGDMERLEVANPIAFEDIFHDAFARDLLDPQINCMVAYQNREAKTLKRIAFRSLFRRREAMRHEISLHRFGGIWYMASYLGPNYEVPVGTVRLIVSIEGDLDGQCSGRYLFSIPVVSDKRNEHQNRSPYPRIR